MKKAIFKFVACEYNHFLKMTAVKHIFNIGIRV